MDQFAVIADMVRESEKHADSGSKERLRAIEYYRGEMNDTPSEEGMSSMTSRQVRDHIKKALPSIVRTIFGGDDVVEYMPVGQGDEEVVDQATDYVNRVVVPEADVQSHVMDAIHDAMLLRNGILKWWWEDRQCVKFSRHTGLTDDALTQLAGGDDVEIVEHTEREEAVETEHGIVPLLVHDVKIKRTYVESRVHVAAVPRENFLIHPDATTLQTSRLTGDKTTVCRSDLVQMGYDRDLVDSLSTAEDDDLEEDTRRNTAFDGDVASQRANDELDYYDLYVRFDKDDDGIAELRHMVFAGGLAEKNLLIDDECDEVQFCDVKVMSQPHQWEGISLFDDLADVQRVSTVLIRQTLDNLYWSNMPERTAQEGVILNPEALSSPEFGQTIYVKQGVDVRGAHGFNQVPFFAEKSYGMLEYMDKQAEERTGISNAASGMAPDALQNMTAKASAMIEQAGIGQVELMVREIAEGLKPLFRGLLRLIVRHQDVPRTVRLRDEWVQFDPRDWNSDMDCTVNTGLGAGTRERDMQVMQFVLGLQEKLLASFGAANNPYVKPENLSASLSKLVESAGLKTPATYFHEPTPEEIQQIIQAQQSQPSPEQIKARAEQEKLQQQMQLEDKKMQVNTEKERAQMEADLRVKQAEIAAKTQQQQNDLESKAALRAQELQWEREKFAAEMELEREKLAQAREDEIMKAQAQRIADNFAAVSQGQQQ